MSKAIARKAQGNLALYEPKKALEKIAVAEAGEKHFLRALRNKNDPLAREQFLKAVEIKVTAQAEYVVWRDAVVKQGGDRGANQHGKRAKIAAPESCLPNVDPGDKVENSRSTLGFAASSVLPSGGVSGD